MARRRRIGMVGFDTKIIQDVGMAAIAVRILPMIISNFFPLDATLYTVVGAGSGYLTGTALKNKTLANASIALGLVEFVAPAIENIVGGFGGGIIPAVSPAITSAPTMIKGIPTMQKFKDYITLNEYTDSPDSVLAFDHYRNSY